MEKRYLLWFFIITLAAFAGFFTGYFVVHSFYADVEARLQMLETQYAASLRQGQELRLDEVKMLISKSAEDIKNKCYVLYIIGLPFTVIALLTSIFGAFKWAAEMAKEKAKEAFKDPETLLKEYKKILVLSSNVDGETWARRFFSRMGFNLATYDHIDNCSAHANKRYDLVFLNFGENPSDPNPLIAKCVEHQVARSVFYFGKGRAAHESLDQEGKLAYANTKSQIYGNLINALRYQKML